MLPVVVEGEILNPPKTAYILLWFPDPTETFIFREVINLRKMGLPLKIFTLYGELSQHLSPEMSAVSGQVERMGIPYLAGVLPEVRYWLKKNRKETKKLFRTVPFRRWNGLEKAGENLWAFIAGFRLARRMQEEGIEHIHAPWACGAATAAWVASRLTGIPFTFTARAWDIYPPDGALREKIRDAAFVRCETMANVRFLTGLSGDPGKFRLTYNGVPLKVQNEAPVSMTPPYKFLAVGRFVGKNGYNYLLHACRILKDSGLDFTLTLAGGGPREKQLKMLAWKLDLNSHVRFPGFVPYHQVSDLFHNADIFLMPSVIHSSGDRDGIPTVIMEALMHRVPVVATDVSGIAELIEDGNTGALIREKDPDAIAGAVVRLLGDRTEALDMAERGRRRVLERFNPEINHRAVLNLYRDLPAVSRT